MKKRYRRFIGFTLLTFLAMHRAFPIEPKGAPRVPAASLSSSSAESGTVTKIDAGSGYLVLDGSRRFTFAPGSVIVSRQDNRRSYGGLAEVKAGTKVSLTVIKSAGSSRVAELWIAP